MENKIHFEILPKRQKKLFDEFSQLDWIKDFYLAGGTALALQIAHRQSVDFDFFSEKKFDVQRVKNRLNKMGEYALLSSADEILDGKLNSIRASFFNLSHSAIIGKELCYHNLRIASKEDLAAMKFSALSTRGSRKDFIDLYFLLKEFSLGEIVNFFEQKYGKNEENVYCALKGMVYFADAEKKTMPTMLRHVTWEKMKKNILSVNNEYITRLKAQGKW